MVAKVQTPSFQKPHIITVKEARKLLGATAKDLSDQAIKSLVSDCEQLARLTIRQYLIRKSGMVK